MDVGSGTGILSMIAARHGAKKVYAVEASDFAHVSRQLVAMNGLEAVVEVVHARVEDVELDGEEGVDIIVSEWMGFHLLHESMFDSVIYARDKWLKGTGIMLPDIAQVFMAPVNMGRFAAEHFAFWEDYQGFDFSALVPLEVERALRAPQILAVAPEQLLADPQCVARLDCKAVSVEEVRAIRNDLNFKSTKEGVCHGFCLWFTVQFSSPHGVVELSTAPGAEPTHWAQTVILLPEMLMAQPGNHIPCKIEMRPAEDNPRHCVVALELP